MDKHEVANIVKNIFKDTGNQLELGWCRWMDEKEYEDINDYAVLFQKQVENKGGRFQKMTKRPFGFRAVVDQRTFQFYATATKLGVKQI